MVNLIVRDSVLLGDQDGTGWVEGHGPVPGDLIRQWIADNLDTGLDSWLRRVYEQPATGNLVAMDSSAELFTGRLAEFLRLRDRICRTVGCGAPIRHADHVVASSPRRTHHRRQRPRTLRVLQLRQRSRRLDRPHHPRPPTHRRDHHPHRTHLQLDRRPALSQPHADAGPRSCPTLQHPSSPFGARQSAIGPSRSDHRPQHGDDSSRGSPPCGRLGRTHRSSFRSTWWRWCACRCCRTRSRRPGAPTARSRRA